MADEKDEIDFEFLGRNPTVVETNFYFDGILDHTKGQKHDLGADLSADYHDYSIEWTPTRLRWLVDGKEIRILDQSTTRSPDTNVAHYPSRPARYAYCNRSC
jgi:beta-glucanase (GH16 family)